MIEESVVIPIQTTGFYNWIRPEHDVIIVVIPIQTTGFYNLSPITD